jgi:hypothetical protein
LKGVEDYDVKAIETIDPTKPITWEECVVSFNKIILIKNETKAKNYIIYFR